MNNTRPQSVTIGKYKSIPKLKEALKKAKVNISSYAEQMLNKVVLSKEEKVNLVYKTVRELGFETYATTDQIYAKAKEQGLELCPPEVGPYLRLAYKEQPLNEWIVVAMEQITDPDGSPRVFYLGRDEGGAWLRSGWTDPARKWNPESGLVFRLRSSVPASNLGTSVALDPLSLRNLETRIKSLEEQMDRIKKVLTF